MKFTELLDRLASPAGELIRRAFAREGLGDPDALVLESPRRFLGALVRLYEDDRAAKLFIYLVAAALAKLGIDVSEVEWLQAFETDDAAYVKKWLEELDRLL